MERRGGEVVLVQWVPGPRATFSEVGLHGGAPGRGGPNLITGISTQKSGLYMRWDCSGMFVNWCFRKKKNPGLLISMVSILLPWLIPSHQLVKFLYISQLALRAVCPLPTTEYEWSGGSPLGGLTAEMGAPWGCGWACTYRHTTGGVPWRNHPKVTNNEDLADSGQLTLEKRSQQGWGWSRLFKREWGLSGLGETPGEAPEALESFWKRGSFDQAAKAKPGGKDVNRATVLSEKWCKKFVLDSFFDYSEN